MDSPPCICYAIVKYDFIGEEASEITVHKNDYLRVVARAPSGWFIAKPIARLGNYGLVPISYVTLLDARNEPFPDQMEALNNSGIPTVEEWQKQVRAYKGSMVSLGTLTPPGRSSSTSQPSSSVEHRVSIPSPTRSTHAHSRQPSSIRRPSTSRSSAMFPKSASASLTSFSSFSSLPPPINESMPYPVSVEVPSFYFDHQVVAYLFNIECEMSDGSHRILSRSFDEFSRLDKSLLSTFPIEAGSRPGYDRIIPYIPNSVKVVTESITASRRKVLDIYLKKLLKMSPNISQCALVRQFYALHKGDHEKVSKRASTEDDRRTEHDAQSQDEVGIASMHSNSKEPHAPSQSVLVNNAYDDIQDLRSRHSRDSQPFLFFPPSPTTDLQEAINSSSSSLDFAPLDVTDPRDSPPHDGGMKNSPASEHFSIKSGSADITPSSYLPPMHYSTCSVKLKFRGEWQFLLLPGDITCSRLYSHVRGFLGLTDESGFDIHLAIPDRISSKGSLADRWVSPLLAQEDLDRAIEVGRGNVVAHVTEVRFSD